MIPDSWFSGCPLNYVKNATVGLGKNAVHCSSKMKVSNLIIILKLRFKKSTFKSIKNEFYFTFEEIIQLIQFRGKNSRLL